MTQIQLTKDQAQDLLNDILEGTRAAWKQQSAEDIGTFVMESLDKVIPTWNKGRKPKIAIVEPVVKTGPLTREQKIKIMEQFREWAGISDEDGPEDANQITVYCDYAMDADLEEERVHTFLTEWMMNPETALDDDEE